MMCVLKGMEHYLFIVKLWRFGRSKHGRRWNRHQQTAISTASEDGPERLYLGGGRPRGRSVPGEHHLATAFGWSIAPWAWASPLVADGSSYALKVGFFSILWLRICWIRHLTLRFLNVDAYFHLLCHKTCKTWMLGVQVELVSSKGICARIWLLILFLV